MGFESKISGYIASHLTDEESIQQIRREINQLPTLEQDEYPFLPRDIFSISTPLSSQANSTQITYRSCMIHFAVSVKELENELEAWLNKFEALLKAIPGAYEAHVNISLDPYTREYRYGHLNYHWEQINNSVSHKRWVFKGDPTKLDEIRNPIYQTAFQLTEELKGKIVKHLQWLAEQKGKSIAIEDQLTANRGNYDRHFARLNHYEFELVHFGVRTSGAMGMIQGKSIQLEFKTDCIRTIERNGNQLIMDLKIDWNTTRQIKIRVMSVDTIV